MSDLAEALLRAPSVALICHIQPDGDTIGSSLALRLGLLSLGKSVSVACDDSIPSIYRGLPGAERARPALDESVELLLAVDAADEGRLGSLTAPFSRHGNAWQIDHHKTNNGYAPGIVRDAAATAELALGLLDELGVALTEPIAECLYSGLSTDTGNFMFANTTASCLRAAARCLETGIPLAQMADRYFRLRPLRKTRLLGRVLGRMETLSRDRFAFSCLLPEDYAASGATGADTESLVQELMQSETVQVAALLRPEGGLYRASLRSRGDADLTEIALRFGGGGHKNAAGCSVTEEEIPALKAALMSLLAD